MGTLPRQPLKRRGRSARTIEDYDKLVNGHLSRWLDTPLAELSEEAATVADYHDELTKRNGPYAANHAVRALRAVYNFARKRVDRSLPPQHPADAVVFSPEARRDTAMSADDLPGWWEKLQALPNAVRREFHVMSLLTGSRPDALRRARWEHVCARRRVLHFPDPKGGPARAFDVPLSRAMVQSLRRARDAGRVLHEKQAREWVFPADSATGYISEYRERRTRLPGVNANYVTAAALSGHLREQQERMSRFLMAKLLAAGEKESPAGS